MTKTSCYFIKTAFLCFGLGMASGLWQYGHYVFNWFVPTTLIMAHTHIILIGGIMNMIIGVAIWFFPRTKKGYRYYNPNLIWTLFWLLNFSTMFRFIIEILSGFSMFSHYNSVGLWFSIFQVVGLVTIFFQLWDRVRTKGSNIREARGESF